MKKLLNPDRALIFRITHRNNLPWILDNGLHCRNAAVADSGFVSIGNVELIDKRQHRPVPIPPGGTLGDYVPFYFTPFSPMMLNIKTGWGGIQKRRNEEVVILVTSLPRLKELSIPFVFSDRHAYLQLAEFFSDLTKLNRVDWDLLQKKDFRKDPNNRDKFEFYQAEALVHRHLPVSGIAGLVCYTEAVQAEIQQTLATRHVELDVLVKRGWYF